ncbi:DUF4126 domain-containing protein [Roseateles violae]|uniref:DUF4126 domain-containing protein n=1 Tax=Roseateles violae TaxID=3058042 RepID=A0ABT8DWI0_9BURK|nr:DUF4126 domain-containing protein [Pelomonas sp. PFR6]MDN3922597.1 DUF4126 domain-containing protein [Pelomonas sp. PFR6]
MALNEIGLPHLFALAAALGWASGMRLYATVLIVGLGGRLGWLPLPAGLEVLTHGGVLIAAGVLAAVEFLADKIPAVDSLWDMVHTVIRIPAGAALAAGALSAQGVGGEAWTVIAALLGGTLAATAHAAKTGTRAAANTSPEPFSNIALSLSGDLLVPALLWLAWNHPLASAVLLVLLLIVAVLLIRLTFRLLRGLASKLRGGARAA